MKNRVLGVLILVLTLGMCSYAQKPKFDKSQLPVPILEKYPEFDKLYWTAWEQAWEHVKYQPGLKQALYMDEGLWDDTIWIWDSEFMVLYCKYAPFLYPGIQTLDNFYYTSLENSGSSLRIQHPDNPPFFAWVENEYFKFTADYAHIDELIHEKKFLQRYFHWFDRLTPGKKLQFPHTYIALEKKDIGYNWGGVMSGMDNTPRGKGNYKDMFWIDAIAQQALSAKNIVELATIAKDRKSVKEFQKHYDHLKELINKYYWCEEDGIYYDIKESDSSFIKVMTPASFWPLLAEVATQEQANKMARLVNDPNVFGGDMPWVTVSRLDPTFNAAHGDYWRGGIWLPTAYMAIKALEKYDLFEEANLSALNLLKHMSNTYYNYSPATIWECYSPSKAEPSLNHGNRVREDFCGWSALGPISLYIENVIGFYEVNAHKNIVKWNLHQEGRNGIRNLRFGKIITDIVAEEDEIVIKSNGSYTIYINGKKFKTRQGETVLDREKYRL